MPRYIDADELKIDYGFTWDDITPTHEEMYALIDRQPTIDAKPVVHSHWTNISISISGHSSAECFVCGCVVHDSFSNKINYCPNCGADMRADDPSHPFADSVMMGG